jgi:hypothetical protein
MHDTEMNRLATGTSAFVFLCKTFRDDAAKKNLVFR